MPTKIPDILCLSNLNAYKVQMAQIFFGEGLKLSTFELGGTWQKFGGLSFPKKPPLILTNNNMMYNSICILYMFMCMSDDCNYFIYLYHIILRCIRYSPNNNNVCKFVSTYLYFFIIR